MPDRIQVFHDLVNLKPAFANAKTEVRRQHMQRLPADIDGRGQSAAGFAPGHRQIDAAHVENRMARQ